MGRLAFGSMKLDAFLQGTHVEDAAAMASGLESAGFYGLWLTETQVDPYLPLAVAATATRTLRLGTGIAVARRSCVPRSRTSP